MNVPGLLEIFLLDLGANDDRRLAVDGDPIGITLIADRKSGIARFNSRIEPLQLLVFLVLVALVDLDTITENHELGILNLPIGS